MRHQSPVYLAVAALATALVIAGIYVTFWGESNVEGGNSAEILNSDLETFAVGEMANFAVFGSPEHPDPVQFVDSEGNGRSFDDWKGKVVLGQFMGDLVRALPARNASIGPFASRTWW